MVQVYPYLYYGEISIFSTEQNGPVLAGSGVCLAVGIFVPPIIVSTMPSIHEADANSLLSFCPLD